MKPKKNPSPLLRSPAVLYLGLSLVAFFPCLVLGQAYFDNDLLAQFGPWRAFLRDQLAQGHFPLWNPYSMGGEPFFANLQTMMLYPPNYLTLPFPVPYGLSLFFFLHLFWTALGTHLWLRALGLSERACETGALLAALSGFFWLEIIHPPVLAAFAWLPWWLWSLEKFSAGAKTLNAFLAGLCFAMLFLCGSFQVSLGALYLGPAYFLFRRLFARRKPGKSPLGRTVFLFFLWGSLPLWGQLIPTLEFSTLTDRRMAPVTADKINPALSIDPLSLTQLVLPRFTLPEGQTLGEAIQGRDDKGSPSPSFQANLGYLGIWMPFLVFWAFRRKDKSLPVFFALTALLGLSISLGRHLPVHEFFFNLVPGFSLILVPFRFLYLFVAGAAALAALGFEEWTSRPVRPKAGARSLAGPLLYALPLLGIALVHPGRDWREVLALFLGFSGIALGRFWPAEKAAGIRLLQAGLILPLLFSGWADFTPGPASNFDFEANSKTIPNIRQWVSPYRVIFDTTHLKYPIMVQGKKYLVNYPQNAACALKIKNFGGYNPMILQAKKDIAYAGLEPLIHLGAIKGILSQDNQEEIPGFKREEFPPYLFYEYQKPLAWAYAPAESHVVPDDQMRLAILSKEDFDLSRQVIFSEPPPFLSTPAPGLPDPRLECRLEKEGTESQTYSVELNRDNWVVFPEVMFPGWKARVDGRAVPLVTADHLLRAVYLPAGRHRVEFAYEPEWMGLVANGLVGWLVITLLYFLAYWAPVRKIFA